MPLWVSSINDPDIMTGMDRVKVAAIEEHRDYVRRHADAGSAVWFVIEVDEKFAGVVWLWDIHERHRRAEVRIFVVDGHRGRGVAREALVALQKPSFRELGLHKLYAYVHEANTASRRSFEAAGFQLEAVLKGEAFISGRFADIFRLCRLASDE